jgi:hypothetical protein
MGGWMRARGGEARDASSWRESLLIPALIGVSLSAVANIWYFDTVYPYAPHDWTLLLLTNPVIVLLQLSDFVYKGCPGPEDGLDCQLYVDGVGMIAQFLVFGLGLPLIVWTSRKLRSVPQSPR